MTIGGMKNDARLDITILHESVSVFTEYVYCISWVDSYPAIHNTIVKLCQVADTGIKSKICFITA
jgi:hypothetical protein